MSMETGLSRLSLNGNGDQSKCIGEVKRIIRPSVVLSQFTVFLVGSDNWFSTRCCLRWLTKQAPLNRAYVKLQASNLKRNQQGSLLPTPTASEGERGSEREPSILNGKASNISSSGVRYGISLRQLAEQGFLPTPVASDATTGAIIGSGDVFKNTNGLPRKVNRNGKDGSVGLARLVRLLPTPVASLYKTCCVTRAAWEKRINDGRQQDLNMALYKVSGITGQLNPCFVMEMMGFPVDWTLLPFLKK